MGLSLLELAERFEADGDFEKAESLYRKYLKENPKDTKIIVHLLELKNRSSVSLGPVSAESENTGVGMESLFKELELGPVAELSENHNLRPEFADLLALSNASFARIGKDVLVTVGVSGDWELSLEMAARYMQLRPDDLEVRVWQLRCLAEIGRYAEVIGYARSGRWEQSVLVHVNYLAGIAFEALGMRDQARLRFEAVSKRDGLYRDISQKLLSY